MIKQKVAKHMSKTQIEAAVKRSGEGVQSSYDLHLGKLKDMFNDANEDSQEELAGFLFAFSQLGNVIAAKHSIKH